MTGFRRGELIRMIECPATWRKDGFEVGCLYMVKDSAVEQKEGWVTLHDYPGKYTCALPMIWFERAATMRGEKLPPAASIIPVSLGVAT